VFSSQPATLAGEAVRPHNGDMLLRLTVLASALALSACASLPAGGAGIGRADVIEHPEKIGIGTGAWPPVTAEQAGRDVERLGASWYYTWEPQALPGARVEFVPMVWGVNAMVESELAKIDRSGGWLLGFNEPAQKEQANMSVAQATSYWPTLEGLNLRLVSPSNGGGPTMCEGVTGEQAWLTGFMREADRQKLRINAVAVHYYSATPDVDGMKRCLEKAYQMFKRPLWVTEWGLADWDNHDRYTLAQTADFLRKGALMMDDLPFVERHAWFAMYAGGDGLHIHTELVDGEGALTAVGEVFRGLTDRAALRAP
jgi:hypothetical protein